MLYVYEWSVFIDLSVSILAQVPFHLDRWSKALLQQIIPLDVGDRALSGRVAIFVNCLHEDGVSRKAAYEEVKDFVDELEFDGRGSVVKSRVAVLMKNTCGSKAAPKNSPRTLQAAMDPEWAVYGGSIATKEPIPWSSAPRVPLPDNPCQRSACAPRSILRVRVRAKEKGTKSTRFDVPVDIVEIPAKVTYAAVKSDLCGRMPTRNNRSRWEVLFSEFQYKQSMGEPSLIDYGNTYELPVKGFMKHAATQFGF